VGQKTAVRHLLCCSSSGAANDCVSPLTKAAAGVAITCLLTPLLLLQTLRVSTACLSG
jgi:hypothetical protein